VFSGKDTLNELRAFTDAFKAYLAGETLNIRYINNLNTALGKHRLRLFVRHKTCISYHILESRIPIGFSGIGEVIFLEKANVTLSASFLGLSTIREPDVILTVDDIADYTVDVAYALDNRTGHTGFPVREVFSGKRSLLFNRTDKAGCTFQNMNTGDCRPVHTIGIYRPTIQI
jgi:hypothetical protein